MVLIAAYFFCIYGLLILLIEIPPDDIEDLFEDLDMLAPNDIGTFIRRLSYSKAGWLAKFIHTKIQRDKELATDEIESEMKVRYPHILL